ncbi:hypothetical protein E2C01_000590 [Portunus trituberculatus]|uniref:Uncharacterized protein n=1 Tax=Portunus trituberculatus TaxID=210409 RepID=A0A5B7CGZ4_PORTR|nr:hypothetical protein [Portunus trituberculatus]
MTVEKCDWGCVVSQGNDSSSTPISSSSSSSSFTSFSSSFSSSFYLPPVKSNKGLVECAARNPRISVNIKSLRKV